MNELDKVKNVSHLDSQLDFNNTSLQNTEGVDVNVVNEKRYPKTGTGSIVFEIVLWILLIIPGIIFTFKKIQAQNYFNALQQKIQQSASQIDNYLEQRVQVLNNVVGIVERSIDLDKDVMKSVAELRSGTKIDDTNRNNISNKLDSTLSRINLAFEAYPNLKSQDILGEAMTQNNHLQQEITASRQLYNDIVYRWNSSIFEWPVKKIVASKNGYSTIIPYTASITVKEEARKTFF